MAVRRFSRSAGSASTRAMVMIPFSWPVITLGASAFGGSARKLKIRPCSGSSARVVSGRFQRSKV